MKDEQSSQLKSNNVSHFLTNPNDKITLFTAILTYCFALHGANVKVTAKSDREITVELNWDDKTEFSLNFQTFTVDKLFIDFAYVLRLADSQRLEEMGFYNEMLGWNVSILYVENADFLLTYCEQNQVTIEALRQYQNGELFKTLMTEHQAQWGVCTVTELHQLLKNCVDKFVQQIYGYGNLYAFFDEVYRNAHHALHAPYWTSTYYMQSAIIRSSLQIARYLNHPDFTTMIQQQAKRIQNSSDSILTSGDKEFIQDYSIKYLGL